jgi:hypothetical protein
MGMKHPKLYFSNLNKNVHLGASALPTNFSSFVDITRISSCSSQNSSGFFPFFPLTNLLPPLAIQLHHHSSFLLKQKEF